MKNILAINLCWNNTENIEEDYYNWIDACSKEKIGLIRIILSSWSINALHDEKHLIILEKIIKYASGKKIEVCLVLNNFVDYNVKNYSDINDEKYCWLTNPFYFKYKKAKKFFKVLDVDYLNKIKMVLDKLTTYNNLKYIEIMNEIDQINCSNKILINWTNNLLQKLKSEYKNRYVFACSISNHQLFKKFKDKLNCYVDLHFYSFPKENAIENIEYIKNKNKIIYLGEYAKYSDSSFLDNLDSKMYFTSGLWAAYFYKLRYAPLHWWWQEVIARDDYFNIIRIYKSIIKKIGVIKEMERANIAYTICSKKNHSLEKNKIKDRLMNIFKHPLFILKEIKSIKKFISKKITNKSELIFRKIILEDNDKLYYLECNHDILIKENFENYEIINLITGTKQEYTNKLLKGIYLIF